MLEILIVLAFFVVVGLNALVSNYFYDIAKMKGFYEERYFWIPFCFGIAGYILVAALPIKGQAYEIIKDDDDDDDDDEEEDE